MKYRVMDQGTVTDYLPGTKVFIVDQLERNLIDCEYIDDKSVGIVRFHRLNMWMPEEMLFIKALLIPAGIFCHFTYDNNFIHIGNFK